MALGFDNFAGVWENEGFEIYDFVFELNFLGFLCLFLKKISGFAGLFEGKNMKFMFWGKKKWIFLRKKRKKKNKSKTKN